MGKVDNSDLMMIITWAMDISFQSPKLKWASWTHTTPYIIMTMKGNREDWQHVRHTSTRLAPQAITYFQCLWAHVWIMMIMVGSKMFKTEYDLKAIMYPAYDTHHKLCNIRGNWNIQQPRLPPNNVGRPKHQFKCPLTWCKWRAGSPPVRFCFLVRGEASDSRVPSMVVILHVGDRGLIRGTYHQDTNVPWSNLAISWFHI